MNHEYNDDSRLREELLKHISKIVLPEEDAKDLEAQLAGMAFTLFGSAGPDTIREERMMSLVRQELIYRSHRAAARARFGAELTEKAA